MPYTFTLLLIGMPIFLLELGMGQKFQIGGAELWKRVHPSLGGLGVASITATAIVAVYYNVVVCWALWYFFRCVAAPRYLATLPAPQLTALHFVGHAAGPLRDASPPSPAAAPLPGTGCCRGPSRAAEPSSSGRCAACS